MLPALELSFVVFSIIHISQNSVISQRDFRGILRMAAGDAIESIDLASRRIVFDRRLRSDVRLEWKPVFYPANNKVEEVGIENLAFDFPVTPYGGHFSELGYNAIAYSNVRNSWVRNVEIRHADHLHWCHSTGKSPTI